MRSALLLFPLLFACKGGDTDDTGDTDTDTEPPVPPATGLLDCYTPGSEWLTQTVDPAKQVVAPGNAVVLDFESEREVTEATVKVWHSDDVTDTPDDEGTSDQNGELLLDLPSCQPMAYLTTTPVELDETKDTYEAHQVFEPPGEGGAIAAEFNSVSSVTYKIIPSLLGVSVDPAKSIIAGTAFDCATEPIEGAQVIVKDAAGELIEGVIVKYFEDSFPVRERTYSSADGLWVAVNVPVGEVTVEMYAVVDSGDPVHLGSTVLRSYADSINISNIYTGFPGGVRYPDTCLAAE